MLETEQGKHIKTVFNSKPDLVSGVGIVQRMSQKPNFNGEQFDIKIKPIDRREREAKLLTMFHDIDKEVRQIFWPIKKISIEELKKYHPDKKLSQEALKRR